MSISLGIFVVRQAVEAVAEDREAVRRVRENGLGVKLHR